MPEAKAKKTAAKPKSAKKPAASPRRAKKTDESADTPQKLRIRVRAYEHKVLDASVKQIMDTANRYDLKVAGPTPLPTERTGYTVNRSSFKYKNAREQFEMRVHKRLVDIEDPSAEAVAALTNLSMPDGVHIEVKML